MVNCYSGDQIAGDHAHTDITICNIEEPQQKYRLGTVSNRLLSLLRNSVVMLTYRPDIAINVDHGRKTTTIHKHSLVHWTEMSYIVCVICLNMIHVLIFH